MPVDLILPCRDEARALVELLPRVPPGFRVIVVDNGSTDDTGEVARRLGATVVSESQPGYGAAIAAGLAAAEADIVAFMDGDGSFDPAELPAMVAAVESGQCDLAAGRRRPVSASVWPWHARLGNDLIVGWLRRRIGFTLRDLPAMRVCRREALIALNIGDRRFGYPVEFMQRAVAAGWRMQEFEISYGARAKGTKSKVSGSLMGTLRTARDFRKALAQGNQS